MLDVTKSAMTRVEVAQGATSVRYVMLRYLPDPVRSEPVNIGVIVQARDAVRFRVLPDMRRRRFDSTGPLPDMKILEDYLHALFQKQVQEVFMPGKGTQIVDVATEDYLSYVDRVLSRQFELSDPLSAQIPLDSATALETFVARLFERLVAPPGGHPIYRSSGRQRIHTGLRRYFKELGVLGGKVRERDTLVGTVKWQVDFSFASDKTVAISTLDLGTKDPIGKALGVVAQWADLKEMREDVERVSVVQRMVGERDESEEALALVRVQSSRVYDFAHDVDAWKRDLASDLCVEMPATLAL